MHGPESVVPTYVNATSYNTPESVTHSALVSKFMNVQQSVKQYALVPGRNLVEFLRNNAKVPNEISLAINVTTRDYNALPVIFVAQFAQLSLHPMCVQKAKFTAEKLLTGIGFQMDIADWLQFPQGAGNLCLLKNKADRTQVLIPILSQAKYFGSLRSTIIDSMQSEPEQTVADGFFKSQSLDYPAFQKFAATFEIHQVAKLMAELRYHFSINNVRAIVLSAFVVQQWALINQTISAPGETRF
jgi:hypothetical protein